MTDEELRAAVEGTFVPDPEVEKLTKELHRKWLEKNVYVADALGSLSSLLYYVAAHLTPNFHRAEDIERKDVQVMIQRATSLAVQIIRAGKKPFFVMTVAAALTNIIAREMRERDRRLLVEEKDGTA